jgi:hypothetical protein
VEEWKKWPKWSFADEYSHENKHQDVDLCAKTNL